MTNLYRHCIVILSIESRAKKKYMDIFILIDIQVLNIGINSVFSE